MILFIKKLVYIVKNYYQDLSKLHKRVDELDKLVRDRTDIAVDVALKKNNSSQIIVVGRYRNADYVQVYSVNAEDMSQLIDMLRQMQKHGVVRRIDAPLGFRAVFERELGVPECI